METNKFGGLGLTERGLEKQEGFPVSGSIVFNRRLKIHDPEREIADGKRTGPFVIVERVAEQAT